MRGLLTMAGLIAWAGIAGAQQAAPPAPRCAGIDQMRALLGDTFGETRRFAGLVDDLGVIELFAGDASWSLTLTKPDGTTCLIAAGYDHFFVPAGDPA